MITRVPLLNRFQRPALPLTVLVVIAVCVSAESQPGPSCEELHGRAMGMSYTIKLVRPSTVSLDDLGRECRDELERLEQIFSLYRSDSELSRLNSSGSTEWQEVSPDLARVTARGLELAAATGGAFDPTIRPLARLWKLNEFSADWRPPGSAEIEQARESVGARWVEVRLEPPAVLKRRAAIELDLNALVEGWSIDQLVARLRRRGVERGLVALGGEFRGIGRRADDSPWRIGIEDPRDPASVYAHVVLNGTALSTSGDYRQAVEFEGRRYSHLLDPRTGAPIRHTGAAVSVLADDALTADGWATALLVLGPVEGFRLAESRGLRAIFVERPAGTAPRPSAAAVPLFEVVDNRRLTGVLRYGILIASVGTALLVITGMCRRRVRR